MRQLILQMLFRKKGTTSAILAIALLIALLSSINSLLNNTNAQTNTLRLLANQSETYVVLAKNSTTLSDSQIDPALVGTILNHTNVRWAFSQQLTQAALTARNVSYPVTVRGVDDLQGFLSSHHGYVNGSTSNAQTLETNIGIILAKLAAINVNDTLTLTLSNHSVQLQAAGTIQTAQQSDRELILPLKTLQTLTQNNATISFIEFSLKDPTRAAETISDLTETLPSNIEVIQAQQLILFAQDINDQTAIFIIVWFAAIYVVVIAASYTLTVRVVSEAQYELVMLRNIGARNGACLALISMHTLIIGFIGCVVGIAAGIVGTQLAAAGVRWVWGSSVLAPFLEPTQAMQITLLTLASCAIGTLYPALTATKTTAKESPP